MPAYQYQCTECRQNFQVRKSMADIDSETVCPECGSSRTERRISNVAFFTTASDGARRAVAGASACAGCGVVGAGCASCHPR